MKIGKIVVGLILVALAVWVFVAVENSTAKYLGGIILAIVGLAVLMGGFKKNESGPKPPPTSPQEPQPPQQPQSPEPPQQ